MVVAESFDFYYFMRNLTSALSLRPKSVKLIHLCQTKGFVGVYCGVESIWCNEVFWVTGVFPPNTLGKLLSNTHSYTLAKRGLKIGRAHV